MNKRTEFIIVKERSEPCEQSQPDVLQSGFNPVSQDERSGRGNLRLPVFVDSDILTPKIW